MGGSTSTSKHARTSPAQEMSTKLVSAWDDDSLASSPDNNQLRTTAKTREPQSQSLSSTAPPKRRSENGRERFRPDSGDEEVEESFKADMKSHPSGSSKPIPENKLEFAVTIADVRAKSSDQLSLPKGTKVQILEVKGVWAWCRAGDMTGWIPNKSLTQAGEDSEPKQSKVQQPSRFEPRDDESQAAASKEEGMMPPSAQLPEPWTQYLGGTMTLHTVQNSMILASYLLDLLTSGYGTRSAVHIACWEGSLDALQAVTNGSRASVQQWHARKGDLTPLHIASICGHPSVVDYLLEMNVDPNINTVHGLRSLHISASSSTELSELLVFGKADVMALTADKDTPLHFACCYQQLDTIEMFLKAGADASAFNNFGVSPLHIASAYAALEGLDLEEARATLLLCAHGANPAQKDHHGRNSADIARLAGGKSSLLDFLQTGGSGSKGGNEPLAVRCQKKAQQLLEDQEAHEELETMLEDSPVRSDSVEIVKRNSGGSPQHGQLGRSDLKLAEENGQLKREIAKLSRELDESRAKRKQLEHLIEQNKAAMAEMKGSAARSQDEADSHNTKAMERLKGDLHQELNELRQREQSLSNERELWFQERDSLQRQLTDLQGSCFAAEEDVRRITAERDAARQDNALQRQVEDLSENAALTEKDAALTEKDAALSQKDAELQARAQAEEEARRALGDKDQELASLASSLDTTKSELANKIADLEGRTKELQRKDAELQSLRTEVQRISSNMQRQAKEKEETWASLQDLRAQHTKLREENSSQLQEYKKQEAAFKEREAALENTLKEQELMIQKLEQDVSDLTNQVTTLSDYKERCDMAEKLLEPWKKRTDELQEAFAKEQAMRKRYHNQMQDMKGAIRVFARIRPQIAREKGEEMGVRKLDAFSLETDAKDKRSEAKTFNFDTVYDERSSQEDVFSDCRALIGSCVDGFNVTVFAYGQTGAGKTHTMYGSETMPGLVPRAAHELFEVIGRYAHDAKSKVTCSMFELYRDDLVDLLLPKAKAKSPPPLDIKKDSRGTVKVENAVEIEVNSPEELLKTIGIGQERRHVAATKMNDDSSRSHLIFIVMVESVNHKTKQVSAGKLTLCDLAGSERLKKSEVTGEQMKEAQSINKSLTALGDVIEALTKQAKHIPYRNHKLTQLLSDSLGGNAKTLMFVNCSPAAGNLDETGAALQYAQRAKMILNKVEKNSDSQEVARLKKVIQVMSSELEQARSGNAPLRPLAELGDAEADQASLS